ncbi:E3 UFM1-protein ligase 1 homolog isoform X2 [Hydra vulgaris]|uniref:E3 UFM1-protein ligase 1 homolog isoform X2 n=1 Tax=Hydra vulgaris TaxID=6087 RepID=A0ABM4BK46_HYDVU
MSASDWEEIKRLAADFQRAQLCESLHKLSERNCIEIVNKLIKLKLLDVIYTIDGKEYLTPQQVEKEIRDELSVHGGRINLVDLQQILNIDLSHIECRVNDLVRGDRHFILIQGQLLDKDYLDRVAEEINETLQEAGQVAIADIATSFNLSADFLLSVIETKLGTIIRGSLDPINRDVLFTSAFIARNIAKIRGIFSAVTRPVHVIQLIAQYGLPEKFFYSVLETLMNTHRLCGSIQGYHEKAIFTPDIYSKTQTNYIDSFFNQNGYIEYNTLVKLGINDGQQFMKKRFSGNILLLSSCCVNHHIIDQVDAAIQDSLLNKSFIDIKPLVPSPFSNEDTNMLLQHCLKINKNSATVFCERVVSSHAYLDHCKQLFYPLMKQKANKDIKTSPALFAELTRKEKIDVSESGTGDGKQAKKDERNKKANSGSGQKGGGGRGARESSTKKTKNKYRERLKGNENDENEEFADSKKISTNSQQVNFFSVEQIEEVLKSELKDCEDNEFVHEIASYLFRPLTREYQNVVKDVFVSTAGSVSLTKKNSHQDYQEKVNGLLVNMKLFEKGLNLFEGETRILLIKHLLKTIGTDIVNVICELVASEHLMSLSENEVFTQDTRLKLLNKLSGDWKEVMTKLNSSLGGKDLEDFFIQLDRATDINHCDLVIKKMDKKKERQILFNHRQSLIDQLDNETDPAMGLHLACVLLFQYQTGMLLHAPGRCVPQLIAYLEKRISDSDHKLLYEYQQLVIKHLVKNKTPESECLGSTDSQDNSSKCLSEGIILIKQMVKNFKKTHQEDL